MTRDSQTRISSSIAVPRPKPGSSVSTYSPSTRCADESAASAAERCSRATRLSSVPREQGVEQHERHEQEHREEQDQPVGVGARHAREKVARRGARQGEQEAGDEQRRRREERPRGVHADALERRQRRELAREERHGRAAALAQQDTRAALGRGDRRATAPASAGALPATAPRVAGDRRWRRAHPVERRCRLAPGRGEDLARGRVEHRRRVGPRRPARTEPGPRRPTAQQRCREIAGRRRAGSKAGTRHHPEAQISPTGRPSAQQRIAPLEALVAPGRRRQAAPAGRRQIEVELVGQRQPVGEARGPHSRPFDDQRRDRIESRQRRTAPEHVGEVVLLGARQTLRRHVRERPGASKNASSSAAKAALRSGSGGASAIRAHPRARRSERSR